MSELLDSQKQRQEMLKGIIADLHAGKGIEEVKEKFAQLLRHVSPTEISQLEDRLIAEGMPESEIKRLCDVHVAVFREALNAQPEQPELEPGHPLHTFIAENEQIQKVVTSIREMFDQLRSNGKLDEMAGAIKSQLDLLGEVEKHYLRKENQLFPFLEKHNITGPTKVMWKFHDDARVMLKKVKGSLVKKDSNTLLDTGEELLKTIEETIYKEENILFPTALKTLSEAEWGDVRYGEEEIGYTLVEPGSQWQPPKQLQRNISDTAAKNDGISLSVGEMTAEQINLMLTHLPVDVTFVDENDKVRYYSQGKERIFPRSPGIIGRDVQNCHPAESVHVVGKIVAAFKDGSKDTAEFWLTLNDRFIHIRYFAVRDQNGKYRGVVEVSQDLTDLRTLQGERRILAWQNQE
ncbi:DUF438 domain-containing protein [Metallumcola ferriviriculae]|uniref:DUF438 domain-containing protein n=1 Tax=Metallumcola ferriviriculae TaxID=3039180 RepID=A0AAU0ULC8_9FIRM|nr:DUF438 domain-containing protein [Desulfitibacteraceae bacterium MK1]